VQRGNLLGQIEVGALKPLILVPQQQAEDLILAAGKCRSIVTAKILSYLSVP
jgi:hypothetical protein